VVLSVASRRAPRVCSARDALQLVVDQRVQALARRRVAVTAAVQQARDLAGLAHAASIGAALAPAAAWFPERVAPRRAAAESALRAHSALRLRDDVEPPYAGVARSASSLNPAAAACAGR
jgi:hypothetical protein